MAYDIYLELKGVEGESTAAGFEKKIELLTFSWATNNPVTLGSGSSGIASGKASVGGIGIQKKTDKASAKLWAACAQGDHFETATITLRKATGTGGQKPFLTFKMKKVYITSFHWSGGAGTGDTPTESVALVFAEIEIEYFAQDDKGQLKTAGQASYDIQKVKKAK